MKNGFNTAKGAKAFLQFVEQYNGSDFGKLHPITRESLIDVYLATLATCLAHNSGYKARTLFNADGSRCWNAREGMTKDYTPNLASWYLWTVPVQNDTTLTLLNFVTMPKYYLTGELDQRVIWYTSAQSYNIPALEKHDLRAVLYVLRYGTRTHPTRMFEGDRYFRLTAVRHLDIAVSNSKAFKGLDIDAELKNYFSNYSIESIVLNDLGQKAWADDATIHRAEGLLEQEQRRGVAKRDNVLEAARSRYEGNESVSFGSTFLSESISAAFRSLAKQRAAAIGSLNAQIVRLADQIDRAVEAQQKVMFETEFIANMPGVPSDFSALALSDET